MTEEEIKKNDNISNREIELDIKDTQDEINSLNEELKVLIKNRPKNRLEIMKRDSGVSERIKFIKSLEEILEYRKNK